MKKTIVTLLTLSGLAMGDSVITGLTDFNDKDSGASITLADGKDTLTMTCSSGRLWSLVPTNEDPPNPAPLDAWENQAALDIMNAELSPEQVLTSSNLEGYGESTYTPVGSGAGASSTYLTLDITSLEVGSEIVIYALGTAANSTMDNFDVDGLDNVTIRYAVVDGNGFSSDPVYSETVVGEIYNGWGITNYVRQWGYTLFRVTGTLTEDDIVLSASNSKKNLWGMVAYGAYVPIPEPTTATLSLLALAGLAARRRR